MKYIDEKKRHSKSHSHSEHRPDKRAKTSVSKTQTDE